jgi:hypothetical protein
MLYPNITYSSMTHLIPAFSCQLSHLQISILDNYQHISLLYPNITYSSLPPTYPRIFLEFDSLL